MSSETLDTTPTPATPDPGTATADKAPAATPAPDAGHQTEDTDLDLLDLDADAEPDGEDEGAADTSAAPSTEDADRPAWQRPEGLQGDELIEWKERQGLPTDATGYDIKLDLKEGQTVTEVGQQLINGLKEFGVEHDLPDATANALANWYDKFTQAQQTKLAAADKTLRAETKATLIEKWGGEQAYAERIELAKVGATVLPQGLRGALKVAQLPDGTRIAHTADFLQALYEIGRLRTRSKGNPMPPTDEARLAEVQNVMRTDIDRYEREGLGKEALDLMRKIDAKGQTRTPGTLTAAEAEEERALVQLMSEDVGTYQHRQWRGLGVTGSDRLLQLRRKREGVAA